VSAERSGRTPSEVTTHSGRASDGDGQRTRGRIRSVSRSGTVNTAAPAVENMKILVTVAEVAEVEDEFEIDGLGVAEQYLDYDLNEWDDYATEEAVQIQEAGEDVEVVSATIGPERSEETIRMALAKGVDRAIRVWDDDLEGVDFLDVGAKTRILAAVVEAEDPDLVLTGVQSADNAFGATGVSLADAIGFEWAAVVNDLDLEGEVASVHRELEGGVEELTDVELPAVLTIQTGINEPRYASLRGIRQAQSKEIAPHTLEDLGLAADVVDDRLTMTDMYEPESESDATLFEGGPDEEAGQLAELLREKGVVEA
jgi:electron transfer flavoprotein beta subunit